MGADNTTKKERYIQLRLDGYGCREATRRAGYESARPPKGARELWAEVQKVRGCDTTARRLELRKEVERLRFELDQKEQELEAVECLADATSRTDRRSG